MTIEEKKIFALNRQFGLESYKHNSFAYVIPLDHDLELIKQRGYWANLARQIVAGDTINIRRPDLSFYGEYIVKFSKENVGIDIVPLREIDLTKTERTEAQKDEDASVLEIKWGGPTNKYQIVNKTIGDIVQSGFANKEEAQKELDKLMG